MDTDDSTVSKTEPPSQASTTSSTPVPTSTSGPTGATTATTPATTSNKTKLPSVVLPEVDLYLHLLVLLFAIDRQKYKPVLKIYLKLSFSLLFIIQFIFIKGNRFSRKDDG